MGIEEYMLKNFFSTITIDFKQFYVHSDEYDWVTSKLDGQHYTCMKHKNYVKIFNGIVHFNNFDVIESIMEFEV